MKHFRSLAIIRGPLSDHRAQHLPRRGRFLRLAPQRERPLLCLIRRDIEQAAVVLELVALRPRVSHQLRVRLLVMSGTRIVVTIAPLARLAALAHELGQKPPPVARNALRLRDFARLGDRRPEIGRVHQVVEHTAFFPADRQPRSIPPSGGARESI